MKRSWIWFLAWGLVGAGAVAALLTVLTVGPYLAVLVLVAAVALGRTRRSHGGLPGLVSGAGLLPVWVAWLNRGGPGDVCSSPGNCTEEWSPWPWLAAGVVLITVGTAIWARRGANSRTGPRPW